MPNQKQPDWHLIRALTLFHMSVTSAYILIQHLSQQPQYNEYIEYGIWLSYEQLSPLRQEITFWVYWATLPLLILAWILLMCKRWLGARLFVAVILIWLFNQLTWEPHISTSKMAFIVHIAILLQGALFLQFYKDCRIPPESTVSN